MLTAGLKRPPLIRKNAQALTANDDPNAAAINSRIITSGSFSFAGIADTAIWADVKPMKRKENVPQNSPAKAITSFRTGCGTEDNLPRRFSECSSLSLAVTAVFRKDILNESLIKFLITN